MKESTIQRSSWLNAYTVINSIGESKFSKIDDIIYDIQLKFYIEKYCLF